MKFRIGIKPEIFMGWGTTLDARKRVMDSIDGHFVFSSFGASYVGEGRNTSVVYGYNIEVYKRGKHRSNKHYIIYRYTFPIEMFKLLSVKIIQGPRNFKIVPKK